MITMNNGKSAVTIIYELLFFLLWNPSKMKYPSFFTNEWVYIVEQKQCFIYYIEISKDRVFKSDIIKEFFSCVALETTIKDEVQFVLNIVR